MKAGIHLLCTLRCPHHLCFQLMTMSQFTSIHPSFHSLQHFQIWLLEAGALEKQYFPHPDLCSPGRSQVATWSANRHSPSGGASSTAPPSSATWLEKLTKNVSRRHPNQRPDPLHLAPLDTGEQRLRSEPLTVDQTSSAFSLPQYTDAKAGLPLHSFLAPSFSHK